MKKVRFAIIISALALLGFACPRQIQPQPIPPAPAVIPPAVTASTTSEAGQATTTEHWVTYTNSELGFSFEYPASWGEVVFNYLKNDYPSDYSDAKVGFNIKFKNFDKLRISGITKDYLPIGPGQAGGGSFKNSSGFMVDSNKNYFFRFNKNQSAIQIYPADIILTKSNSEALIIDQESFITELNIDPALNPFTFKPQSSEILAALINLQHRDFTGFTVALMDKSSFPSFNDFISKFHIFNPIIDK